MSEQTIRVDLNKYLPALEMFAGKEKVKRLKDFFAGCNLGNEITVHRGREKDREVGIPYTTTAWTAGSLYKRSEKVDVNCMLSFNARAYTSSTCSNVSFECRGWKETLSSYSSSREEESQLSTLFVGGLFGAAEIRESQYYDMIKALHSVPSCWDASDTRPCDLKALRFKAAVEKGRSEDLERKKEEAKERTVTRKLWEQANHILSLAKEHDHWYNRIDSEKIKEIVMEYSAKNVACTTSKCRNELAKEMWDKITSERNTFSGTYKKMGADCNEWDHRKRKWCPAGQTGSYEGEYGLTCSGAYGNYTWSESSSGSCTSNEKPEKFGGRP